MSSYPNIPEVLTTERLTLRCPRLRDVPELVAAVRESLGELRPWMPWAGESYGSQECEQNTREAIAKFVTRQDLRYHAHDRQTGGFIVGSGLHRIDWSVPKVEIGYWCRSSRLGQGYVTETVRALARMAFEGLGAVRVEIRCDDLNDSSYRVAERCGFGLEGVLRQDSRGRDGTLRSTRIYALTDLAKLK